MQTIKNYVFRDMGVMLGRSVRYMLRSMDVRITVFFIPIVFILVFVYVSFLLLFVYVFGSAIQILGEVFFTIIEKKEIKWKR